MLVEQVGFAAAETGARGLFFEDALVKQRRARLFFGWNYSDSKKRSEAFLRLHAFSLQEFSKAFTWMRGLERGLARV